MRIPQCNFWSPVPRCYCTRSLCPLISVWLSKAEITDFSHILHSQRVFLRAENKNVAWFEITVNDTVGVHVLTPEQNVNHVSFSQRKCIYPSSVYEPVEIVCRLSKHKMYRIVSLRYSSIPRQRRKTVSTEGLPKCHAFQFYYVRMIP